jgi:ribosomal protein S18 acetylase RimI-like enzyme
VIAAVKAALRDRDRRLLLVETSGAPGFAGRRAFYRRLGFRREARVRDYDQAGEDKVTFTRALRL